MPSSAEKKLAAEFADEIIEAARRVAIDEIERFLSYAYDEAVTINNYEIRKSFIDVFDGASLRYRRSNR